MFELLEKVNRRPRPFETYTADVLWNDEHISQKMLEYHLNEDAEPASRNRGFIDKSVAWLVSRFGIETGTRICDFGCGPGLYTTQFAQKGAAVTGIDFSERSIGHAKKTAKQLGLEIDYVRQDYLTFETDKKFDLITMIYCDYCALSPEKRSKLLRVFRDSLDSNGSIVLDVFSLSAFEQREESCSYAPRLMGGFWSASDYYGFLNTFKYENEKVMLDKYTIIEASRTWEVYNWLQYFSLEFLRQEFEANGLRLTEHFSDVAGAPFKADSPEIAVVVERVS